jgi:hypothetical protein
MLQHLEDVEDIIFKKRGEVGKSHRHRSKKEGTRSGLRFNESV